MVRVSAANEAVAKDASSSPYLYTRVRSRIRQERERREAGESWLTMLSVVWRTVPAMALVAVFALILFLSAGQSARSSSGFSDEALLDARDVGVEQVVFADSQPLSTDEVLATVLGTDEQGASK
ncbi:MAG: hypothetical protein QOC96_3206 [Acidobacteriota bacterium]|nr:hypothetical protein [Acidobacteriota bacterium]